MFSHNLTCTILGRGWPTLATSLLPMCPYGHGPLETLLPVRWASELPRGALAMIKLGPVNLLRRAPMPLRGSVPMVTPEPWFFGLTKLSK
jgi:hypothetical protein